MDDEARKTSDDGAVDPDELQVATHLELDPIGGVLSIPAFDRVGDECTDLTASGLS